MKYLLKPSEEITRLSGRTCTMNVTPAWPYLLAVTSTLTFRAGAIHEHYFRTFRSFIFYFNSEFPSRFCKRYFRTSKIVLLLHRLRLSVQLLGDECNNPDFRTKLVRKYVAWIHIIVTTEAITGAGYGKGWGIGKACHAAKPRYHLEHAVGYLGFSKKA